MGLEALSDADLMALKAGDITKVSDAGLMALKGGSIAEQVANDPISLGAKANLNPREAMRRDTMLPLRGKNLIDEGSYALGGAVTDYTGSPFLGAAANVAAQSLPPMQAGARLGTGIATPIGRSMAERLMQSAAKPPLADMRSGKGQRAIATLLDKGYDPTTGGAAAMAERAANNDDRVRALIGQSSGDVDKYAVADRLRPLRAEVGTSPLPQSGLNSVDNATTEFLSHPDLTGRRTMPIQLAQDMKQRGYKEMGDAAYGMGLKPAAERDSLKAITRGLKEEIEAIEPVVKPLNAETRELLNARKIALRRALVEGNNNPVSLPVSIAAAVNNPALALGMWANTSGYAKSKLARMLNAGTSAPITKNAGRAAAMAAMLADDERQGQQP